MKILSLDSATESASCAILDDDRLLGEITYNYKKQHSVLLMPMIDELLSNLGLSIDDMDGFVVSKGPGSFTGLRIGSATMKGLSQGTGKPFASVSSLDAMAYNLAYTNGLVCSMIDALRNNVYTRLYVFDGDSLNPVSDMMAISMDELMKIIKEKGEPVTFVGDATCKFKETLKEHFPGCKFAPAHLNLARASSLGELGMKLLANGSCENLYSFAPTYLRKSQAEQEYEKKARDEKSE